mmetsp:Transcript_34003/g.59264  ORF Transcript_34003/g.59264 Transcript_34003/m.59264 type:complete len:386 (-) Transcript_34003:45-1202(-)
MAHLPPLSAKKLRSTTGSSSQRRTVLKAANPEPFKVQDRRTGLVKKELNLSSDRLKVLKPHLTPRSYIRPEHRILGLSPMQRSRVKLSSKLLKSTSKVKTQFARSRTGSHRQRQKPITQDSLAICNSFQGRECDHLFMVCDGHGDYGHLVSNFITQNLPTLFGTAYLQSRRDLEAVINNLQCVIEKLENELMSSNIDTALSGSTLVTAFVSGDRLFLAHLGDSRVAMGSKYGSHWIASQLTTDHKPENSEETKRILRHGGEVRRSLDSYRNPSGPYRVWLPGQDGPGLAMSRSIGDRYAKEAGVVASPEIKSLIIAPQDRFLIIASDGIWDVIGTEEAVNIVARKLESMSLEESADALVDEAHLRWRRDCESVDDITVIVVVFDE